MMASQFDRQFETTIILFVSAATTRCLLTTFYLRKGRVLIPLAPIGAALGIILKSDDW